MVNADWILTEEERDKLWEEYEEKDLLHGASWQEALIKAEAKKIVVWLLANDFIKHTGSVEWQTLRKEVLEK